MSQPHDPYNPQPGDPYAQGGVPQPGAQPVDGNDATQIYSQNDPYAGGQYGSSQYGAGQYGSEQYGAQGAGQYGGGQYGSEQYGGQGTGDDPTQVYGQQSDPYGGQANPYGDSGQQAGSAPAYGSTDPNAAYAAAGAYPGGAAGGAGGGLPPYGNDPYGQSPYGSGPQGPGGSSQKNGLGLAAMILGLAGILVWIAGTVGLILGIIGLGNVKKGLANNRGQALTGVIAGAITTVLGVLGTIALIAAIGFAGSAASKAEEECNDQSGYEWQNGRCVSTGSNSDPQQDDQDQSGEDNGDDAQGDAADEDDNDQGGSDGGDEDATSGKPAELADGITLSTTAKSGKASETAAPQSVRGKEIAILAFTVKNSTESSYTPPFPISTVTYGGKKAEKVTDTVDDEMTSELNFQKPVAAGDSRTFNVAYAVPKSEMKNLTAKYEFRLKDGNTKSLTFTFK